jgi:hypothetical protein
MPYLVELTVLQIAGSVVFLRRNLVKQNWPLRMRCVTSIPEMVIAVLLKRLKPSITFVLELMLQMILLDQIVQVFRGSDLRVFWQQAVGLQLAYGPV